MFNVLRNHNSLVMVVHYTGVLYLLRYDYDSYDFLIWIGVYILLHQILLTELHLFKFSVVDVVPLWME